MLPTIFRSKFFLLSNNSFVNNFSRKSTNFITKNDYSIMIKHQDKIETNKELKNNNSIVFQLESTTSTNHNYNNNRFNCNTNLSRMQRNQEQGRNKESINKPTSPSNYDFLNQSHSYIPWFNHHIHNMNQQYHFNNFNYYYSNNCYYDFNDTNNYFVNSQQISLSDHNFHRPDTRQFSVSNGQGQASTSRNGNNDNKSQRTYMNRSWEFFQTNMNKIDKNDFVFTVMSYNVLAQDLIIQHPYLYVNHKKSSLNWSNRWRNLWREIQSLLPDILCLQEVQFSHLRNFYSDLKKLGYSEIYKQRTGVRTDGCAIYFKTDLIQLIEYTTVEFNQPKIQVLNRDNVAIIAKFVSKNHHDKEFIIATTHLLFNPKRQDVRLAQIQLLLTEIDRLAFKTNSNDQPNKYLPVILTGDFNSTPYTKLYHFITNGQLKYNNLMPSTLGITDQCQHADLLTVRLNNENISRKQEIDLIKLKHSEWNRNESETIHSQIDLDMKLFSSGTLTHQFPFKSVYNHFVNGDMEGTTFQNEWVSVDYIFYSVNRNNDKNSSGNNLTLLGRYKLPRTKELRHMTIPNEYLGSDHLSLMAKFKL